MASTNTLYIDIVARDSASGAFREAGDAAGDLAGDMEGAGETAMSAGEQLAQAGQHAGTAGGSFASAGEQASTSGQGFSEAGSAAEGAGSSIDAAGSLARAAGEDLEDLGSTARQTGDELIGAGSDARSAGVSLDTSGMSARTAADGLNRTGLAARDAGYGMMEAWSAAGTLSAASQEATASNARLTTSLVEVQEGAVTYFDTVSAKAQNMTFVFGGVAASANDMGDSTEAAGAKMSTSLLNVATGVSGLTLSAYSLYKLWDSIEDKQVALDRANRTMESSQNNLTKAQQAYNRAVEEYGADSIQATSAALSMENAQRSLENASVSAEQAQKAVNDAQTQAYLMTIPGLITGLKSAKDMYDGLVAVGPKVVTAIGNIDSVQKLAASSAFRMAAGAGAFTAIYVAFTTDSEDTRVAMSLLAGALVAAASAQWILNAAQAFGLSLTVAGLAIVGVAAAAAATTYALASTYGAPTDQAEEETVPSSTPVRTPAYGRATAMADGGIAPAGSNVFAMLGDGPNDEAVIPLPRGYNASSLGMALGGGNTYVTNEWHITSTRADAGDVAREMYALIQRKGGIRT